MPSWIAVRRSGNSFFQYCCSGFMGVQLNLNCPHDSLLGQIGLELALRNHQSIPWVPDSERLPLAMFAWPALSSHHNVHFKICPTDSLCLLSNESHPLTPRPKSCCHVSCWSSKSLYGLYLLVILVLLSVLLRLLMCFWCHVGKYEVAFQLRS